MKAAMLRAALGAGALAILSLPFPVQAQTTVIPGKEDSTVIINLDGKAPVVLDVNRDIKGVSDKPKADKPVADTQAKDAAAKGDAGLAAEARRKSQAETTGQDNAGEDKGSIKADCVTKTSKESKSVDSTKGKCR